MFRQEILTNGGNFILGNMEYNRTVLPKQNMVEIIKLQLANPKGSYVMKPALSTAYGISYRIISNGVDLGLNPNKYEVVEVDQNTFMNSVRESAALLSTFETAGLIKKIDDIGLNKELKGVIEEYKKSKVKTQPTPQPVQPKPTQPKPTPQSVQPKSVQPQQPSTSNAKEIEEINKLKVEKEGLEKDCNRIKAELNNYNTELTNLKTQKESIENEIKSYKEQKETLIAEINDLKAEIESLKTEKEKLENQPIPETQETKGQKVIFDTDKGHGVVETIHAAGGAVVEKVEEVAQPEQVEETPRQIPLSDLDTSMDISWDSGNEETTTTEPEEPVTLDSPLITHSVFEEVDVPDAPKIAIYLYGKLPENTAGQKVSITGTTKEFAESQYEKGEQLVVPYVELAEDNEEGKFALTQSIKRLINDSDAVLYDKKLKSIYDALNGAVNKFDDNIDLIKLIRIMNRKFGTRTPDMLYNMVRLDVMKSPNGLYNGVPYLVYLVNTAYQMSSESTDEKQKATKAFDAVACYINAITSVVDDESNDDDVWDQLDDDFDGEIESEEVDVSPLDRAVNQVLMAEEMLTKYLEEQMYSLSYDNMRVMLFARFQVAFMISEQGKEISVMTNPVLEKIGIKGLMMSIVNNELTIKDTMGNVIIPIIMSMAIYKNRIRRDGEPATYNAELQRIWRLDKESVNDDKYPKNVFSSKIVGLNEATLVNEKKLELAITHVVYTKTPVQHIFGWGLTDQSPTVLAREKLYFVPIKSDNFKLENIEVLDLTKGNIARGRETGKYGIDSDKSRELLLSRKLVPVQVALNKNQLSTLTGEEFLNILSTNTALRLCNLLPAHKKTDEETIEESLRYLAQKSGK